MVEAKECGDLIKKIGHRCTNESPTITQLVIEFGASPILIAEIIAYLKKSRNDSLQ